MDEFVTEKYIEISISTGIAHADLDSHFFSVTIQQNL